MADRRLARGGLAGRWLLVTQGQVSGGFVPNADSNYFTAFDVAAPLRIDQTAVEMVVGGTGNVGCAWYQDDGDGPGAVFATLGSVAATVGSKIFAQVVDFPPGRFWLAVRRTVADGQMTGQDTTTSQISLDTEGSAFVGAHFPNISAAGGVFPANASGLIDGFTPRAIAGAVRCA